MCIKINKVIAKECAAKLVERATDAEMLLRDALIEYNVNFEFQKPLYSHEFRYVADFFIIDQRLIVVLDGSSHNGTKQEDLQRTANIINHYGYNVIRFNNKAIYKDVVAVLGEILNHVTIKKRKRKPQPKKAKGKAWMRGVPKPEPKAKPIPLIYQIGKSNAGEKLVCKLHKKQYL